MMSPKLFSEFRNGLKLYLKKECDILVDDYILVYIVYADDPILCSDSLKGLQKLIYGLFQFCKKWHLIVSLAKTKVLIFGKKGPNGNFIFNGSEIKITTEYKYVGSVESTQTRNIFGKNQDHIAEKCNNAVFALKDYSKRAVDRFQPSLTMQMFDSQIACTYNAIHVKCLVSKHRMFYP